MKTLAYMRRLTAIVLIVSSLPHSALAFRPRANESPNPQDLMTQANRLFGRLPASMASDKNPITPEKARLGKILFYETRISIDGTVSCSRCHPFSFYGADGLRKSIGNRGAVNVRNAPTVLNAAAQISAHWIGNRADVEDQAGKSVVGPASFGMASPADVEKRLKDIRGYALLFQEAFPEEKEPITVDHFAKAVGAFERTLVTPSPFDLFLAGDTSALDERARRGLKTFMDHECGSCHSGACLGGQSYQKFGLLEPYGRYTKSEPVDTGRYATTNNESDRGVFKVPVLRNVAMTSPYFHDGSVDDLESAVWIMGKVQLGEDLPKAELGDLRAFLRSLTGTIPKDALLLPLLPSRD